MIDRTYVRGDGVSFPLDVSASCALCDKPVEQLISLARTGDDRRFIAECHGKREIVRLSACEQVTRSPPYHLRAFSRQRSTQDALDEAIKAHVIKVIG